MAAFSAGDKVAWSHSVATQHGEGSISLVGAVLANDPAAKIGTVKGVANTEKTYFKVDFGKHGGVMTLTADELVKVADA